VEAAGLAADRATAEQLASANPIVAALVEMVSALYYERRRQTAARAADRDLRDAAEAHRRIYRAIRAHDAGAARTAMHDHLTAARHYQAQERSDPGVSAARAAPRPGGRAASRRQ
jgi:GntR family transcriptional repressor for pyruvate dehydrogenase complex